VPVLIVEPENRQGAHDLHARGSERDEDHRLLTVGRRAGIGLAHDDEQFAPRVGRARRPPLPPVDDVMAAVAHDRGPDVARVGGCDIGLGHGKARADASVEQRIEPPLLLVVTAEQVEQLHVARVGSGAVHRLGGQVGGAPGKLRELRVLDVGEPRQSGQEQVPQPERARGSGQPRQDGRDAVVVRAHRPPVRRVLRLGGIYVLVQKLGQPLAQRLRGR
jgi:hypothetical protein